MNLNITVNEAPASSAPTYGNYFVRVFYTEVDGGHQSGPFATREAAEQAAVAALAKPGVLKAVVEGSV